MNFNYFLVRLMQPFNITPKDFIVETTNICNLKCVGCDNKLIKSKGELSLNNYKKILKQLEKLKAKSIAFDLGGEPLLNENTLKMVKLASQKGIKTFFSSNATFLDKFETQVFDSGLDTIMLDLDGMSNRTYSKFRKNGDFTKVINNIKNFCLKKKALKTKKPQIILNYIVTKYNEKEIPKAISFCKEYNINYLLLKKLHSMIIEPANVLKLLPENKKFQRDTKKTKRTICDFIFNKAVIRWNGQMGLCCYDIKGEYNFGTVKGKKIIELLKSKTCKERQKKIVNREFPLCKSCTQGQDFGEFIKID
ncbi:MAG: radical SAM/SPASM domain-containing protein [Candidatus Diapherotrites archaeon]